MKLEIQVFDTKEFQFLFLIRFYMDTFSPLISSWQKEGRV